MAKGSSAKKVYPIKQEYFPEEKRLVVYYAARKVHPDCEFVYSLRPSQKADPETRIDIKII